MPVINNFDLIADFYDELVSWAPYELWITDLLDRLQNFGLQEGNRILDAACGSGLSTIPMARKGFVMTGIDRSAPMIELARKRAMEEGVAVELRTGDLLALECCGTFHAVTCLHSGLDYILEIGNLQKAFDNLRQCLEPGGFFAFDKCLDEPGFYQNPQRDKRLLDKGRAVFNYRWDRGTKTFEQDCSIYYKDGRGRDRCVRMKQRMLAVPPAKLIKMVESAGFEMLKKPETFRVSDPGMGIFRAV